MSTPPAETPPPPMTDEDVADVMRKLSKLTGNKVNEICNGYTQQIKSLITTVRKSMNPRTDEDEIIELDRLSRIISLCPSDEIFIRSKDKIWFARHRILNQDADWFLNRDYSASIKKDQKQVMIETLIKLIQTKYISLSQEERNKYWEKGLQMLRLVADYKKLTGEK